MHRVLGCWATLYPVDRTVLSFCSLRLKFCVNKVQRGPKLEYVVLYRVQKDLTGGVFVSSERQPDIDDQSCYNMIKWQDILT